MNFSRSARARECECGRTRAYMSALTRLCLRSSRASTRTMPGMHCPDLTPHQIFPRMPAKPYVPPEQGKASMPMSLTPACRVKNRKWSDLWRLLKTPDFIGVLTRFRLFKPSSAPRSVLKASKRRNPLYIAALRPFPRVFSGFHRVFYAPHQSPLKR